MSRLHEIRLRSDAFIANMNVNIAKSIEAVEKDLVGLNKSQMLSSKDANDKPLIHSGTRSPNLSIAYARRTGKSKPNLLLSGDFQREMFLDVNENNLTYFIDSLDWKNGILTTTYGNIFGISESNQSKAKKSTSKSFKRLYRSQVLRK